MVENFSPGNSSSSSLFALSRIYFCFPLIVIQITFQKKTNGMLRHFFSAKYVFTLATLMSHIMERRSSRYAEIYLLQYKVYKSLLHCHWFMAMKMKFISGKKLFYGLYENNFLLAKAKFFYPWIAFFRSVKIKSITLQLQVYGLWLMGPLSVTRVFSIIFTRGKGWNTRKARGYNDKLYVLSFLNLHYYCGKQIVSEEWMEDTKTKSFHWIHFL